jgi:hypothetical protein
MGIIVSAISVVQGTGSYVKQSVLEVTYTLAADGANADHLFDLEAQFQLTTALPAWNTAYLQPNPPAGDVAQTSVTPGTHKLLIRVPTSLSQAGIASPFANYTGQLLVRVRAKDLTTNEYSAYAQNTSAVDLKANRPQMTAATMPQWIGNIGTPAPYIAVPVSLAGNDGATPTTGDPSFYRISQDLANLADGVGPHTVWEADGEFAFSYADADGEKVVYVKCYDQFYNSSEAMEFTYSGTAGDYPYLQKARPSKARIRLVGSAGHGDYTGIAIAGDGSFSTDRSCKVYVAADSPIPMTFRILPQSDVEQAGNVDVDIEYTPENVLQVVNLTTNPENPTDDDKDMDATVTVVVSLADAAGNGDTLYASIRLNTRTYQSHFKPLKPEDAFYRHMLREVGSSGNETTIPRSTLVSDHPVRAWNDIFYPATHSYPTDQFGEFDEAAAIAMNGVSNNLFDAVTLQTSSVGINGSGKTVVYDDEGRPVTSGWTADGSKNYSGMLSSSVANLTYWTIDNEGYGDFTLDFEYFDLDPNAYGPPFNPLSPYRGDVLCVYDATAAGAMSVEVDPASGRKKYTIADSTKLKLLMAFTGGGTHVMDLVSRKIVNANTQGGFSTDVIRGIPQVVLMLYTDADGESAGFKLKSGPRHDREWLNFDVDEKNGQFWVHKHASLGTTPGASDDTTKRLIGTYLSSDVTVHHDTGEIEFATAPSGSVTADYTYYTGSTYPVSAFIASQDDVVNFSEPAVYLLQTGETVPSDATRNAIFEVDGFGRITTGVSWNKDAGTVEFDDTSVLPTGRRICADFYHHTYKRISSDGFADLTFNDAVLVADNTPSYPDYTFTDIKLVNEGDAMCEGGKLVFVARGYDTNGDGVVLVPGIDPQYPNAASIVDRVLDINRPWDVQRGTKEETYDVMACAFSSSFIWTRACLKSGGTDPSNTSATGILGTWKNKTFGNIAARAHLFGRVVWVLGGSSGTSYPQKTTAGAKRCSFEVSGKYYLPPTI